MRRSLGTWQLTAAIYFCVSGGAFGLEPVVKLGPGMAMLLILVTPVIWSLPAALMTAELSTAIPEEGGYVQWVRRAIGQPWSFLCGWWSWVYSWVDVAIYPTLFVAYMARFLDLLGYSPTLDQNPLIKWLAGLAIILPLTALNLRGARLVGDSSVGFFVVLVAPFMLLLLLGSARVLAHPELTVHPFVAGNTRATGVFGAGLFAAMWNYMAWDSISTVSGEVKNPQRAFPLALGAGLLLVVLSYLLPTMVGVLAVRDSSQWVEGAWVLAARAVGGTWLAMAMAVAGIVSTAGQFSATLLSASRVPFVLADEGYLPRFLTKLHPRFGTPWNAILISAVVFTAFSYQSFQDLAVTDVVLYSSSLVLELLALAVLRAREPGMARPYRIPGGWPVLILVVLLPAALLAFSCYTEVHEEGLRVVWISAAALATGPIVLAARRPRSL